MSIPSVSVKVKKPYELAIESADQEIEQLRITADSLDSRLQKVKQLASTFYTEDQKLFDDLQNLRKKLKATEKLYMSKCKLEAKKETDSKSKADAVAAQQHLEHSFQYLHFVIHDFEKHFRRKPHGLLRFVLGSADFYLHTKQRGEYKKEYENFKIRTTAISGVLALINLFIMEIRFFDTIHCFMMLYYFATMSLREFILLANGSNIRGWWIVHHHLSALVAATILVWPAGQEFQYFRPYLYSFAFYQTVVQFLQYRYQMRRLYTLRALNKVGPMDVVTDDPSVHFKSALSILLPFLLIGHAWQLYNGYILWQLANSTQFRLWQVSVLAGLFVVIGVGNLSTTLLTYYEKMSSHKMLNSKWTPRNSSSSAVVANEGIRKDEGSTTT